METLRGWRYVALGALWSLSFPLLFADEAPPKVTKAPPPHHPVAHATTKAPPRRVTTAPARTPPPTPMVRPRNTPPPSGVPPVRQPQNPGSGVPPYGRRMPSPPGVPPTRPAPIAGGSVPVHTWQGPNGAQAQIASDGSVRRVTTQGMTITHSPWGGRQIVAQRPNHVAIVTNGAGHGYVQQPFTFRGHEYAQRTYYSQGHTSVNYYRSYSYRNVSLVEYTPVHYYSPMFYGWAYHPWGSPASYVWGWSGSPWYESYGGYFAPYPSYPSAAFWLTDYLIAASLQAAYQQQMDAQAQGQGGAYPPAYPPGGGNVTLTPDVKDAISAEVQRQLALENSEQQQAAQGIEPDPNSSGLPRTLADGSEHVFVVANPLDVSDSMGQSCVVSEGDVLQLQSPPPQEASAGFLYVMASKKQDCPKGAVVTVAFADLQDMQNQMRVTVDGGLDQMQAEAGKGEIPAPPPGASAPPVQSAFAPIAPPPDPNAAVELSQQAGAASTAEQQVMSQASPGGRP